MHPRGGIKSAALSPLSPRFFLCFSAFSRLALFCAFFPAFLALILRNFPLGALFFFYGWKFFPDSRQLFQNSDPRFFWSNWGQLCYHHQKFACFFWGKKFCKFSVKFTAHLKSASSCCPNIAVVIVEPKFFKKQLCPVPRKAEAWPFF